MEGYLIALSMIDLTKHDPGGLAFEEIIDFCNFVWAFYDARLLWRSKQACYGHTLCNQY
jgi:hypothetical protein